MRYKSLYFTAFSSLSIVLALACSEDPNGGNGQGTTGSGSTASTGSGTSGNTTSTVTTSDSSSGGFDLTSGPGTTDSPDQVIEGNGGTVPLSAEEVALIKTGECAGVTAAAEPIPPVIQLVVDVSRSMDEAAPGETRVSRWDLARPALLDALDALPDGAAVGLQLFPTSNPAPSGNGGPGRPGGDGDGDGDVVVEPVECVAGSGRIPIAPLGAAGSAQRSALADALNQTARYIGTPTHDAYHNALEQGLKVYEGPGDKFMLLMTDGVPTQLIGCVGSGLDPVEVQPIVEEVTAAAATGIGTFVIGSPGSEDTNAGDVRPFLSELAMVGGSGAEGCVNAGPAFCHFDMTQAPDFSQALAEGLAKIADQVASTCAFAPPADIDPSQTAVIVERSDGSAHLILNDADADCGEGWTWNAAGEIELCAATCEALKADPGGKVSVSLGCAELIR